MNRLTPGQLQKLAIEHLADFDHAKFAIEVENTIRALAVVTSSVIMHRASKGNLDDLHKEQVKIACAEILARLGTFCKHADIDFADALKRYGSHLDLLIQKKQSAASANIEAV